MRHCYLSQLLGFVGDLKSDGVAQKLLTSAAVAVQTTIQQPLCLLTLSKSGTGLRTNGAPNSDFNGCSVMSNSKANCNGSDLKANYGLAASSNDGCGIKKKSNIPAVADPYAKLAINIPADNCGTGENAYPQEPRKHNDPPLPATNTWSGSKSISGVKQMCGDVQLTGNVVINTPDNLIGAVIVIYNGQLDLNGKTLSTAGGSAVTIVFSGTQQQRELPSRANRQFDWSRWCFQHSGAELTASSLPGNRDLPGSVYQQRRRYYLQGQQSGLGHYRRRVPAEFQRHNQWRRQQVQQWGGLLCDDRQHCAHQRYEQYLSAKPLCGGVQDGGPDRANRHDPEQKSIDLLKSASLFHAEPEKNFASALSEN